MKPSEQAQAQPACRNCAHYHAFYRKYFHSFGPIETGRCDLRPTIVGESDHCIFWAAQSAVPLGELLDAAIAAAESLLRQFAREEPEPPKKS